MKHVQIVPNVIGNATATASSEASPAQNLINMLREEVWHSDAVVSGDLADQTITIDFNAAFIDVVVLDRHNISGTGSWQAQLLRNGEVKYDSGGSNAGIPIPAGIWRPGIDAIGATYNDQLDVKTGVISLDTPVFCDQLKITISDPGNVDKQLQVGRVLAGIAIQLQNNISWGADLTVVDETEHVRTGGGTARSINGNRYRRQVLPLDWLTPNDQARLFTDLQNKAQSLFISTYPQADNAMQEISHQFIARRVSDYSTERTNALFGRTSITVEEI